VLLPNDCDCSCAGSYLRGFLSTENILRTLYVLLIVSCVVLFNVLDSALPTGLYFGLLLAYATVSLLNLLLKPADPGRGCLRV
jgi:hypothetical protein